MMHEGAFIGFAPCVVCNVPFAFDVDRVPSFGRKPICRPCLDKVNARKRAMGLPEWKAPRGAYPLDEDLGELDDP